MHSLNWLITIVERKNVRRFTSFYEEHGINVYFVRGARGTASSEVLDILGFDSLERSVIFSMVTAEAWPKLLRGLRSAMRIDAPGMGIAVAVPVSTAGGVGQLGFLTFGQALKREEVSGLKDTRYELLTIISEHGYSDMVMDAARDAGAKGGTVINARGTGSGVADRLLGVSIGIEKEMILVVVRSSERTAIMEAVMKRAGLDSPARSIVFSLPVTASAGMLIADDDET